MTTEKLTIMRHENHNAPHAKGESGSECMLLCQLKAGFAVMENLHEFERSISSGLSSHSSLSPPLFQNAAATHIHKRSWVVIVIDSET